MSDISIEEASRRLNDHLRLKSWYLSVGVGETDEGDAIFLYVKTKRHRDISKLGKRWMGFSLIVEAVGSIRPASSSCFANAKT